MHLTQCTDPGIGVKKEGIQNLEIIMLTLCKVEKKIVYAGLLARSYCIFFSM